MAESLLDENEVPELPKTNKYSQWVDQPVGAGFYTIPMEQKPPEMVQGSPNQPTVDFTREAGAGTRALGSIKATPQGRAGLAEKMTGDQVFTDANGNLYLYDAKRNEFYPYDNPDLTLNDVADMTGGAISVGPMLAAGTNPVTVGLAGAAGESARLGISSLLPGEDNLSLLEQAGRVGTAGLGAGAFQKGANTLFGVADAVRPHNLVASYTKKRLESGPAQVGRKISQETGVPFTVGQETKSPGILTVEGMLRRHPMTADLVADIDTQQMVKALSYLDDTMGRISARSGGYEGTGTAVESTFNKALNMARSARSGMARKDFRLVDQSARGAPTINIGNTLETLDDLIAKNQVAGGGDATAALVNRLEALKRDLTKGLDPRDPKITGAHLQRLLEVYGKARTGSGSVFQDIEKGQQRRIAGELFDALGRDLDNAVVNSSDEVAQALKVARDNWRINSQTIDEMGESVLGRLLGGKVDKSPERVAEAMLRMKPTELKTSFSILNRTDPQAAQSVKRLFVEDALTKAGLPQASRAPGRSVEAFKTGTFLETMRKSPVWDVLSAKERREMTFAFRALERLAGRAGTDGSPTAPLQFAWDMIQAFGGGLKAMDPISLGQTFAGLFTPKRAAEMLMDPKGRKALVHLTTSKPGTKNHTAAAAYFATLLGSEDLQAEVMGTQFRNRSPGLDAALSGASTSPTVDLLQ